MKTYHGLRKIIFWIAAGTFLFSGAALAYDISGTVTYGGGKSGRIYISAKQDNSNSGYGVSIDSAGVFTIRGVPDGNYTVGAFKDYSNTGIIHANMPVGLTPNVNVSGSNVNDVIVSIADPAFVQPVPPSDVYAFSSGNGTAAIIWDSEHVPYGPYDAVIPSKYNLYWSANPDVMSNVTGSILGIPANDNNNIFFLTGLTNSQAYYYLMTGTSSTVISSGSTTASVTITPPTGGYTVSGSVEYSGFDPANKKLYVMLWGNESFSYQTIALPASPASPVVFSVTNVPDGTYWVVPVFDMNNNGLLDNGDIGPINNAPKITVSDSDISDVSVTLSAVNAGAYVTTNHNKRMYGEGYYLNMNIEGMVKRPVNIVMTGGAQVSGPVDIAIEPERGSFNGGFGVSGSPIVGDSYSFDVTYSDDTMETLTAQVTGVLDSVPTPVSPVGYIPFNATPTFTWQAPSSPPSGEYTYGLWLNNNNGIWWDAWDLPGTQLSAVYNSVGDSSSTTLGNNTSYWWEIRIQDSKGNSASHQAQFYMGSGISGWVTSDGSNGIGGVWVTVYSDTNVWVGNTMTYADGAYSMGGFEAGNYKVFFDGSNVNYVNEWYDNAADFNSAASVAVIADQTTQNINATLAQTGSISGRVTDGAAGIQGVTVQVCQYESGAGACNTITSSKTDADGYYTLGGLSAGPYRVQFRAGSVGYIGEWYNDKPDMLSANTVTVTAGVTTTLSDAVLAPGGGIFGRVTNGSTGIQNVAVRICQYDSVTGNCGSIGYSVNTDASGNYFLGGRRTGQYKVQFDGNSAGYLGEWYNDKADQSSADVVTLTEGETTPLVDAVLVQGGGISGRVTYGGAGIQYIWVQVCQFDSASGNCEWGFNGVNTDANGDYTLGGLPSGQYKVQFAGSSQGYATGWYNNATDMNSSTAVTVTAGSNVAGIDEQLVVGGTVSGKVTDSSGAGLANVDVWAELNDSWAGGSGTDSQGNYSFVVAPGTYEIKFNLRQPANVYMSEWIGAIEVAAGQNTSGINAQLRQYDAWITGTVTEYGTGNPLVGVNVNGNTIDGKWNNTAVNSDGSYTLAAMSGLEWDIRASAPAGYFGMMVPANNYSPNLITTPTIAGPNTVNFTAHRETAWIEGTVKDEYGVKFVEGALFYANRTNTTEPALQRLSSGHYSSATGTVTVGVEAGSWRVGLCMNCHDHPVLVDGIQKELVSPGEVEVADLADAERRQVTINAYYADGALEGTVYREDGVTPVPAGIRLNAWTNNALNGLSQASVGPINTSAETDANGTFRLPLLGGSWNINAVMTDWNRQSTTQIIALTTNGDESIDPGEVITGAAFVLNLPVNVTITASSTGNGTISPGTLQIPYGNTADFTISPDPGYSISSVGGTCGGTLTGNTYTTNSVTNDCTVIASFALSGGYSLTINTAGNGFGDVSGAGPYNSGVTANVSASPHVDSTFTGWSGDCSGANPATTVFMDGPKTCTANFAIKTFTVYGQVSGLNGSITPVSQTVNYNSTAQLTLLADLGYHGRVTTAPTCGGSGSNQVYTTGPVTADCTVTAEFEMNALTLTTAGAGTGTIQSSPTSTLGLNCGTNCSVYPLKTVVVLTANPGVSSSFAGWSGNCLGTNPTTTVSTIGPRTCTATFGLLDTTPNSFSFNAQTGVALSTLVTSNTITVSGINAPASISIISGDYSVNGSGYTNVSGTVTNGQTVTVRQTSSASNTTVTTATLTIGGVSGTFTVTTLDDTVPNSFSFTAQTGVALSTVATSNTITVSGINAPAAISITNGSYSINGGGYTSAAGMVTNGQTVKVRQTSSASFSTMTSAVLTIGGVSGSLNVTTEAIDTTPNSFSFTARTGVALSALVTSNAITVSGINAPAAISITNGKYSISGGAYMSATGTVTNGQTVTIQQTSSAVSATAENTTLTIGGVSAAFTSTTLAWVPDGDLDASGAVTAADALKALRITAGIITPTSDDFLHGDVSPVVNHVPQPNGHVDIGDVVVILRKAVGLPW